MSGELAVRAAMLAALQEDAALMAIVNGVYDGTPVQASAPHVVMGESVTSGWGARDVEGCDIRIAIMLVDRIEAPTRLAAMVAAVADVLERMPDQADGWRMLVVRFLRSRIMRARDRSWSAVVDYRVRAVRES